jgi:hypothetical protein
MISETGVLEHNLPSTNLLQQISSQHQNLGVGPKALDSSQISHSLLVVLGRRHDLKHMKRRPRHVMPNHFQIDELQKRRRLKI